MNNLPVVESRTRKPANNLATTMRCVTCIGTLFRDLYIPCANQVIELTNQKVVRPGIRLAWGGYIAHWLRFGSKLRHITLEAVFAADNLTSRALKAEFPWAQIRAIDVDGPTPISVVFEHRDIRECWKQPALQLRPEQLSLGRAGFVVIGNMPEAVLERTLAETESVLSFGSSSVPRNLRNRIQFMVADVQEAQKLTDCSSIEPEVLARKLFEEVQDTDLPSPMRCVTGGGTHDTVLIFKDGADVVQATMRPVPVSAQCPTGAGDVFTISLLDAFAGPEEDWITALEYAAFSAAGHVSGRNLNYDDVIDWMKRESSLQSEGARDRVDDSRCTPSCLNNALL